ncbi:hypothetical protein D9C73_027477 [Collichthys lucidus]|uniref:Uncharacterized protein n=1 Tax=Collichthys lucidus TaxID=240159 RepID=A0A4U5VUW2_COLLU|nr:hypothetical protein D9C73_027477 [Collichthys lucidus]
MLPTDTNNGIQLDEARDNAAGPSYRPAAVTGDRPPAQAGLAEAVPAGNNNNPSHFVKVKTKRKWLNRIRQAFSSSKPPVMSGKDKETTMDNNNGIPSDKATTAGPGYRPETINDRTPASNGNRPPIQTWQDEAAAAAAAGTSNNPSDFVEVKTKHKWLKRIRQAFSSSKPPVMSGKDEETTMDNNNGIPSDEATAAGPSYRPETVTYRTPANNGNRPPIQTWQDEAAAAAAAGTSNNPSDFVKVKTKHKWLKRVRQAFSGMA